MSEKPPAFQFYPKDWLSDAKVRTMTAEQRGHYIDLLATAWLEHGLPSDEEELRSLMGLTPNRFRRIWTVLSRCWHTNGSDRLISPRMERYRKELEGHRERVTAAGKAGAEARWRKQ